jgi:hypothetical protein
MAADNARWQIDESTLMTTSVQIISDPEKRRVFNLFGRLIELFTKERKNLLRAAKQATTKGAGE